MALPTPSASVATVQHGPSGISPAPSPRDDASMMGESMDCRSSDIDMPIVPILTEDGVSPPLTRQGSDQGDSSVSISSQSEPPSEAPSAPKPVPQALPASRHISNLTLQAKPDSPHLRGVLEDLTKLRLLLTTRRVVLDGYSLDIPTLVAVSQNQFSLDLAPGVVERIDQSVSTLTDHLQQGEMVYGVNTGFGGSADVRTEDHDNLQRALVQHQNVGILDSSDTSPCISSASSDTRPQSLSTEFAKGTMLVRINTIIRGHSAVSSSVVNFLIELLERGVVPVIPSRGTVSASGDLMPLSYIAGLLQGNPAIFARVGTGSDCVVKPANQVLKMVGLEPIVLGPKEGLGLLNGTATSGCVGGLALHEVNQLAVLTQITTALNVEALAGTMESFHPFIASVRPHPGQMEVAHNIYTFLNGTQLATSHMNSAHKTALAQDRYALRTAAQFLGPVIEDLRLATTQIATELNSTTDNPLIDYLTNQIHHGGNFQGMSVSMAMEKSRLGCGIMGKMLFAQTTELMNPAMNRGLPPNLAPDDPSKSFLGKGVDIAVASYCSELQYLANPVVTSIQSAEMHNQSLNSLALISARQTSVSSGILMMMLSNCIWAGLQAVDLRVILHRFLLRIREKLDALIIGMATIDHRVAAFSNELHARFHEFWLSSTGCDLEPRSHEAASAIANILTTHVMQGEISVPLPDILFLRTQLASEVYTTYSFTLSEHKQHFISITPEFLGTSSRRLYQFARQELGLPFHAGREADPILTGHGLTVGGQTSVLYRAIRDGTMLERVVGQDN